MGRGFEAAIARKSQKNRNTKKVENIIKEGVGNFRNECVIFVSYITDQGL
jgi:hypothetical protein